jgi:predicted nucleic acid-binding protein
LKPGVRVKTSALLDSNVLIATIVEAHAHHIPSLALFAHRPAWRFAVAAHSYAETYSTLTRRGDRSPFQLTPDEAWAALESIRAVTFLVGLGPAETVDAVRAYAKSGGIGARLHDRLIGEAAIANGLGAIVTWNVAHMRGLFPELQVVTPEEYVPGRGR